MICFSLERESSFGNHSKYQVSYYPSTADLPRWQRTSLVLCVPSRWWNDHFPKKTFSSILEMTKISHLNWFQCIKGDPNNGRDELEPNRSYLNHISTWYAKLSNFYMYFCWKLFTLLSLGETAQGTFTNKKTRTKMSTWDCGSPRMCPGLIKFKKQEEKLKWQNIFMNMTMLVWKAEECVSAWFNKCHRFRVQTKIQISHRLFYFYLATTKILTTLYPINAWFRNIF